MVSTEILQKGVMMNGSQFIHMAKQLRMDFSMVRKENNYFILSASHSLPLFLLQVLLSIIGHYSKMVIKSETFQTKVRKAATFW